jgi:hypothetical protein
VGSILEHCDKARLEVWIIVTNQSIQKYGFGAVIEYFDFELEVDIICSTIS